MKAICFETFGEPWDVARCVEVPPLELKGGQVRVSLEAAPVHIADLIAMRGREPFFPIQPGVGGFEGVGRVIECGPRQDRWAIGDRVFLPIGYGAWAAEHCVDAQALTAAPENVPAEQLALVPINLATAYLNLFAYEPLRAGDWAVHNAANSNVGTYMAAIAADKGIHLIHVVRRDALIEPLEAQGRSHVILDGDDLAEVVGSIAADPPKLAIDALGGAATARLGACVADGGLVLSYGFLSKQPHQLAYPDLMFRGVRLEGMLTNFAMERLSDEERGAMTAYLSEFVKNQRVTARIAGVYPFSEISEALRHAARTGEDRDGKIILTPA